MTAGTVELSVVLPCLDERENLAALTGRLIPVLERVVESFEVIFVDDASRDGSAELLDAAHARDPRIKIVHFSRNFGHQAALSAGLTLASGSAVVLMDCDLQDPPEVIEEFVARWREGYRVAYGVRRQRKEGLLKRSAYGVFYRSLRAISHVDVPLDAGDFCLMDRAVVDVLCALPESNRFLRGLRSWVGFRQIGVEYERAERFAGTPRYTFAQLLNLAISGYVGFSALPLRLAAWLGILASGAGLALGVWAAGTRIFGIPSPQGWASTMAVILFVGGAQLFIMGVIGEYLGRVYDEVRQRPAYVVERQVGFDTAEPRPRNGGAS